MSYPRFIKVNDKKYPINTDFRVAIECDEIGRDESISPFERALAIIYKLFGEDALRDSENHEEMIRLAKKYLGCGKEVVNDTNEEPDMNFIQDMDYIKASFRSDYNIDLNNEEMHWWEFSNLLNGLSNSELGNCCILNKIRNLRNFDEKKIKDPKQLQEIREAKQRVAQKKREVKKDFTDEQKRNIDNFLKNAGIERK